MKRGLGKNSEQYSKTGRRRTSKMAMEVKGKLGECQETEVSR